MLNLVPDFIISKYKNNLFRGKINTFCLYSDIIGFTSTTEKLMKFGNEGADTLSKILKEIFSRIVKTIHNRGGFITHFAGDGFFALYEYSDSRSQNIQMFNSFNSALSIQNLFKDKPFYSTPLGDFEFAIKIGISCGEIDWGITDNSIRSFYFKGNGIKQAVIAESRALKNEIIFDDYINRITDKNSIISENIDNSFFRLKKVTAILNNAPQLSDSIQPVTKEIFIKNFISGSVFSVKDPGEFRYVAPVFLSYEGLNNEEGINKFISYTGEEINKYNGHLKDIEFADKGNLIVCFFGAPVSTENNISKALDFVINIFQTSSKVINNPELKLKAGITYGQVYSGIIGGEEYAQYSCIGDFINLASRLMTIADWGQILVNDSIGSLSDTYFHFNHIGKLSLKGFEKSIDTYELLDKHEEKFFKTVEVPFVGRTKELEQLHNSIAESFSTKTGRIAFVNGEAGIGKSKLAVEVHNKIFDLPELLWLDFPGFENVPQSLYPFRVLFLNFFSITQDLSQAKKKALFNNKLDKIIKKLQNIQNEESVKDVQQCIKEIDRTRSILASLADIYWEDSLYEKLAPALRMDNVFFAVCNFISSLGYIYNVLLEFDNVHTLDKETIQLIKYLTQYSKNKPVFFLFTGRYFDDGAKFSSKLQADVPSIEIDMQPLEMGNILVLSEKLLGFPLDKPSVNLLKERTNGNPYFVEQLVLDLKERGQIKIVDNKYSLSSSELIARPTSLNSILTSRFDRLPAEVKTIVQHASVLGRKINPRILSLMLGITDGMEEKLKTALQNNVLVKSNETTYTFYHDLLRDAVYDMHLKSTLTKLHLLAANSYKSFYDKNFTLPSFEQYSYHLGLGYNIINQNEEVIIDAENLNDEILKENTLYYLNLQKDLADKYQHLYYNNDAIRKYKLIVQLSKLLLLNTDTIDYLIKTGELLKLIGKYDDAMKLFNESQNISIALKDQYRIAQTQLSIGKIYERKNDYDNASSYFQHAFEIYDTLNNKGGIIDSLKYLGIIEYNKSNYKESLNFYNKKLKLCKLCDDNIGMADTLNDVGTAYLATNEHKKALKNYLKSLEIYKELNYSVGLSKALGNIGIVYMEQYDYNSAMEYYKKKLKLCKQIGDKREIWKVYSNIANTLSGSGNFDKALKFCERQLIVCKELGDQIGILHYYLNLSKIYINQNTNNVASGFLLNAYEIAKKLNLKQYLCQILISKVEVLINLKKLNDAKKFLIEGTTIAEEINNKLYILYFRLNDARIRYLEGYKKEAMIIFDELLGVKFDEEFYANVVYEIISLKIDNSYKKDEFCKHKIKALNIYKNIYKKTNNFILKTRVKELSN